MGEGLVGNEINCGIDDVQVDKCGGGVADKMILAAK